MNWKTAQNGIEIGTAWFRMNDANEYPRLHIGAAKSYQDELLTGVTALTKTLQDVGGMSVSVDAFAEHWMACEWKVQS